MDKRGTKRIDVAVLVDTGVQVGVRQTAGLAVRDRIEPRDVPGTAVREILNRQGARLDG